DFIFPTHSGSIWYQDLSVSGYLHLIYMSVELTIILAYTVIPILVRTIYWVSGLLTAHVILGQVQPSWYATHEIWNVRTVAPTLGAVLLIWTVALFKIRRAKRN